MIELNSVFLDAVSRVNFSGFVKTSLIDYPGKVAAVVFTQGCNFRCGFCHNPDLITMNVPKTLSQIPEAEILEYLEKRRNVTDGVVVTGGEPLLNPEIRDFITKVKDMGLEVKVDTNGSKPVFLKSLIYDGLVDYVAMDVKGALEDYPKICGFKDTDKIKESIDILLNGAVEYEFRTTVLPYYHNIDNFHQLGKSIAGARKYTIQGFRPKTTLIPRLKGAAVFTGDELLGIGETMKAYVKEIVIHSNL